MTMQATLDFKLEVVTVHLKIRLNLNVMLEYTPGGVPMAKVFNAERQNIICPSPYLSFPSFHHYRLSGCISAYYQILRL